MNLDRLFSWIIGVVIAFAACGQLDTLQRWIWRAQAQLVYESRTSTWGSGSFRLRRSKSNGKDTNECTKAPTQKSHGKTDAPNDFREQIDGAQAHL